MKLLLINCHDLSPTCALSITVGTLFVQKVQYSHTFHNVYHGEIIIKIIIIIYKLLESARVSACRSQIIFMNQMPLI